MPHDAPAAEPKITAAEYGRQTFGCVSKGRGWTPLLDAGLSAQSEPGSLSEGAASDPILADTCPTHAEIINRAGGAAAFTRALNANSAQDPTTRFHVVRRWEDRDRIPVEFWPEIVEAGLSTFWDLSGHRFEGRLPSEGGDSAPLPAYLASASGHVIDLTDSTWLNGAALVYDLDEAEGHFRRHALLLLRALQDEDGGLLNAGHICTVIEFGEAVCRARQQRTANLQAASTAQAAPGPTWV